MAKDNKKIIKDERFSSMYNDFKFKPPKTKNLKVKVDDRFSKDELDIYKKKAKVDRYGRKIKEDGGKNKDFEKFYEMEKEEKEKSEKESSDEAEDDERELKVDAVDTIDKSESTSESESQSESDLESESELEGLDRARGEGLESSSDEDEDSSVSSEEEEVEESDGETEVEIEDSKPEEGEPTYRFAVVNMDWDNVKTDDLFATFSSFLPVGGSIKDISIYPSEFGKERMQKEELEGPPRELFKKSSSSSKKGKDNKNNDEESESESDSDVSDLEAAAKKLYEDDDGKEDYDSKALRRYQLQRLRYYYAVVTCDSVATAQNIYQNCDSTEYESTANLFDLRYIPDDMSFEDEEATQKTTRLGKNYKPTPFVTDALQHSKVKLTWDETPAERIQLSNRSFTQREIEEMDFKAYLASDSDEESENGAGDLKNKYKALAESSGKIGNKSIFGGAAHEEDDGDVDFEVTFTPGLAEGSRQKEDTNKEETTVEKLRRKEKERRKKRKEKVKEIKKQQDEGLKEKKKELSSSKRKTSKDHTSSKDDEPDNKAELELLMMDDQSDEQKNHFNMKDIIKAAKSQHKGKKHNKKKNYDEENLQADFKPDLSDDRFNEIFENHEFAIDPTAPQFKKTAIMSQIIAEKNKRRKDDKKESKGNVNKKHKKGTTSSNELDSLVGRLKNKH
ncbi:hypothetical protein PACTADRAFT_51530 [Pachysolen tannophilus NRRL Y-2460]|uniref:Uncharacterized protein n=1 Tax=Pachysolen tannophilus NRRL Y-2460 TaxID=669874 RepID=A0A1E4TQ26_PACTA|nr:hypothetical protein PACTADRAFT_51530 [Pachysolen tannophilus NRRL Y-2460]